MATPKNIMELLDDLLAEAASKNLIESHIVMDLALDMRQVLINLEEELTGV